jgi:DedD protein
MEKKKLLLVTISVGVFLVIVIGASILVFSPRNPASAVLTASVEPPIPAGIQGTQNPVSTGIAGAPVSTDTVQEAEPALQVLPATADPADMVRNPDGFQTLQTPPSSISTVQENTFYINNDTTQPVLIERKEGDLNTRVVINVPRPTTAAVPNARADPPSSTARTASGSSSAGNTASSGGGAARQPAAAPAKTTTTAARTTQQPVQQQPRTYNAYWVQTGSFPTRDQADKAKEILAAKGLTAVIENGNVRGETWYRVRVGPYTSQNEADYWLSLIKSINGKPHIDLASSIVWQSNTR